MDRDAYPSELKDRFILRLPQGMRDLIAEEAKARGRSMNAEFIARLQESFEPAPPSADAEAAQELADSREQTIRAMAIIQRSLSEAVQRLFGALPGRDQRDRHFVDAVGLASSLNEGTQPGDYLLTKVDMQATKPALARFIEETIADEEAQAKRAPRARVASQRARRTNL